MEGGASQSNVDKISATGGVEESIVARVLVSGVLLVVRPDGRCQADVRSVVGSET